MNSVAGFLVYILLIKHKGELVEYVNYTRDLKFDIEPDYSYLKELFKKIMKQNNYEYDYCYDWSQKLDTKGSTQTTSKDVNKNVVLGDKKPKHSTYYINKISRYKH